jgi:S1-C subfamily serine protease
MPVENGLLVLQVAPSTPASAAGLKGLSEDGTLGDIIVSADGQAMNDLDDLYRLLDKKNFGETIRLEIFRNGATTTVPVRLTPIASSGTRNRRGTE